MSLYPVIPLGLVGLFLVVVYVASGYVLQWMERNPLKLIALFVGVMALFLFIRFAPGALAAMRASMCGG